MTISVAGRNQIIVCDCCGNPCVGEIFEETHWFVGQENDAATKHYCCLECKEEGTGVTDRILEVVDRQEKEKQRELKKELNTFYRLVCPRCKVRIRRINPD